jgi:hypothetical protein
MRQELIPKNISQRKGNKASVALDPEIVIGQVLGQISLYNVRPCIVIPRLLGFSLSSPFLFLFVVQQFEFPLLNVPGGMYVT